MAGGPSAMIGADYLIARCWIRKLGKQPLVRMVSLGFGNWALQGAIRIDNGLWLLKAMGR